MSDICPSCKRQKSRHLRRTADILAYRRRRENWVEANWAPYEWGILIPAAIRTVLERNTVPIERPRVYFVDPKTGCEIWMVQAWFPGWVREVIRVSWQRYVGYDPTEKFTAKFADDPFFEKALRVLRDHPEAAWKFYQESRPGVVPSSLKSLERYIFDQSGMFDFAQFRDELIQRASIFQDLADFSPNTH